MLNWTEVLTAAGLSTATLIALLRFFGKTLLTHFFSKDIEHYKNELNRTLFAYQTRFSRLHATRAEVIAKVYAMIVTTHKTLNLLAIFKGYCTEVDSPDHPSVPERRTKLSKQAHNQLFALSDYIKINKLYFPQHLGDTLEALSNLIIQRLSYIEEEKTYENYVKLESRIDKLTDEFETALKDIEKLFRELLEGKQGS